MPKPSPGSSASNPTASRTLKTPNAPDAPSQLTTHASPGPSAGAPHPDPAAGLSAPAPGKPPRRSPRNGSTNINASANTNGNGPSADARPSAPRSRRTGSANGGSISLSSSSSSSLSFSASPVSCDTQPPPPPRHGPARLASLASAAPTPTPTPALTLASPALPFASSTTRRSPTSPSAPPTFPLAPPTLPAPAPSPVPASASSGNAARRSTSNLMDGDVSAAGGSSGIAYRSLGSAGLGASSSTVALAPPPPPMAPDTMSEKPSGPVRSFSRRARSRPWSIGFLTLLVSLVGATLLGLIIKSFVARQFDLDPKGCRMSYMRPSYAHLAEFDTEHTRFASKYSLYLYREQGIDHDAKLKGVPVIFVPGNAGSYKQVRPIAAEAANYFHDVVQHNAAAVRGGARSLDFFTVDFNEDITAFHGQTMLDQAEYLNEAIRYILSLYLDPRMSARDTDIPEPTSVMILGHSMGGIVARTMLIMPNYQSNSINTIVTLSAPHARAPVTFDREIVQIYERVNAYWRDAYAQPWANQNPLRDVTLISIAGGGLDTIVPSDYASLESLVPATHGFTVFTTTIPHVWTSMDHQAILWCDQFRKAIARALYDAIDVRRATQTKPRAERMRLFRRHLLTGMEADADKDLVAKDPTTLLTLDHTSTVVPQGERLVLRSLGGAQQSRVHLLPVPPAGPPSLAGRGKRFTLLTDQRLDEAGAAGRLEVLFCSALPANAGQAGMLPHKLEMAGDKNTAGMATRLACTNAASDVVVLPASQHFSRFPFTLDDERAASPFSYLQYELAQVAGHQFVAVVDKTAMPTAAFVAAEFSERAQARHTRDVSMYRLLAFGLTHRLPAHRPLVSEIHVPAIQSSLLAFTLEVGQDKTSKTPELFSPLLRQYLSEPFESKYYVNARHASISLHGVAPYMPPRTTATKAADGLTLQLWTDPTCNASVTVQLRVDVLGSLGKLYMRYRTVFAAFPVAVVALVLQKQLAVHDETGVFVSFAESLDLCLRTSLPVLVAALSLLALSAGAPAGPSTSTPTSTDMDMWHWRSAAGGLLSCGHDLLVGVQDPFFWFLVPLITVVCVAVCTAVNYMALALTALLSLLVGLASARPAWVRHGGKRRSAQTNSGPGPGSGSGSGSGSGPMTGIDTPPTPTPTPTPTHPPPPAYFAPAFLQSTPRRRVLTTAVLLVLVSTVIPYQFAYLVAVLVQLATTVRALRAAADLRSTVNYNFYNYAHSIFLMMLWILPINLPILAVWVRNLAVHWLTPFSSHHNLVAVMPFILLVETLATGRMVPRVTTRLRHVAALLLYGLAAAGAVYGVAYAYTVHHLVNAVAAWLVIVHAAGAADGAPSTAVSALFTGADRKQGKTP